MSGSSSTDAMPLFENTEQYALDGPVESHRERQLQSRVNTLTLALGIVGVLAVVGIAVGASAHSQATNAADQVVSAEAERQRNYQSELAGMMLMNQPVCRQTYFGYVGCLDLMGTLQSYVRDLADHDVGREEILAKLKDGEYNYGNALAFATSAKSHDMAALHPALSGALEDDGLNLTIGDLVDMDQCDYVWPGVGCLRMARVKRSPECALNETEYKESGAQCNIKVVPVVHILEDAAAYAESDRRRTDMRRIIGGVAGGIPDKRPISSLSPEDRRRHEHRMRRGKAIYNGDGDMVSNIGGNGACGSGLGEPLMCHCNSRGCGYLDYNPNDFQQDFGKNWDHPDVQYGGEPYSYNGAPMR